MSIFDILKKKKKPELKRFVDAEAHGLDTIFENAARLVLEMPYYSESYLQRELDIGYDQALRITIELENAGIIGPIIESMVPREILINDEKELDEILLSIQEHGFHSGDKMYIIKDEGIRRKIDEIKQKAIEITSTNYRDYCPFDIAAFSYQVGVAEWKGFCLITINGIVFHAHRDMNIVELLTICPPLSECKFGTSGAKALPENYSYFYMGAGNHLFVCDIISDEVKELSKDMDKNDLRQQWEFVVLQSLKISNEKAGGHRVFFNLKISKVLSGKSFFITQFKGGWDGEWPDPIMVFLSNGKMRTDDDLFYYNSKNEVPREIRGGSGMAKITNDESVEGPICGDEDGEMTGRILRAAGYNNFWFYEIDFSKIDSSIDEFQYIILDYQNVFREPRKMLSYPSFKIKAIKFPQYISNKKDYGEFLSETVPQIMDENNCLLYDTNLYKEDFSSILVGRFIRINSSEWKFEPIWESINFKEHLRNKGLETCEE